MKYITGQGENIKVIELPDDARPITASDEIILNARKEAALARQQEYKAREERNNSILEKQTRIGELKRLLTKTDYKAIKYAEGEVSEEEYASVKLERIQWRAEINRLEEEIKSL